MEWLVFIDTNIFLDFYRSEGKQQQGLSVLDHLEGNYDRFITSSQVEMEFKKNRQPVIIRAFEPIGKLAGGAQQALPAFLEERQAAKSLVKAEGQARKCIERLRKKTNLILDKPTQHDDVYKKVQRLFAADTPHNLNRVNEERFEIRKLARRRFDLGYPPRKNNDTSMGDAINWEWIIHCAKESKRNVVIVSRDSDYGQIFGKQRILNTWLRQEFYDRTSKRHKIHLTTRLTDGLERANITVSPEEQQQESEFIERRIALDSGLIQVLQRIKLQNDQFMGAIQSAADSPLLDFYRMLGADSPFSRIIGADSPFSRIIGAEFSVLPTLGLPKQDDQDG